MAIITPKSLRHTTERDNLIAEFNQHKEFVFYLTGSRFFGNERADSDYDFATESSVGIVHYLKNHGFRRLEFNVLGYYKDTNIASVWRHSCGIDVQIRKSIKDFLKAQSFVHILDGFHSKIASDRTRAWNIAFDIVDKCKD